MLAYKNRTLFLQCVDGKDQFLQKLGFLKCGFPQCVQNWAKKVRIML